jgi:hypothetical protein
MFMLSHVLKRVGLILLTLCFLFNCKTASAAADDKDQMNAEDQPVTIYLDLLLSHINKIEDELRTFDVSGTDVQGVPISYMMEDLARIDGKESTHSVDYMQRVLEIGYPQRLVEFGVRGANPKPKTVTELLLGETKIVRAAFEEIREMWRNPVGDNPPPKEPSYDEIVGQPNVWPQYFEEMRRFRTQRLLDKANGVPTQQEFYIQFGRAIFRANEVLENYATELGVAGLQTVFNYHFVDNKVPNFEPPHLIRHLKWLQDNIANAIENMHTTTRNPVLLEGLTINAWPESCFAETYADAFYTNAVFNFDYEEKEKKVRGKTVTVYEAEPIQFSKIATYTTPDASYVMGRDGLRHRIPNGTYKMLSKNQRTFQLVNSPVKGTISGPYLLEKDTVDLMPSGVYVKVNSRGTVYQLVEPNQLQYGMGSFPENWAELFQKHDKDWETRYNARKWAAYFGYSKLSPSLHDILPGDDGEEAVAKTTDDDTAAAAAEEVPNAKEPRPIGEGEPEEVAPRGTRRAAPKQKPQHVDEEEPLDGGKGAMEPPGLPSADPFAPEMAKRKKSTGARSKTTKPQAKTKAATGSTLKLKRSYNR